VLIHLREALFFLLLLLCPLISTADSEITELSHFELSNGLQLYVLEDHRTPLAVTQMWYRVGSADEGVGEAGLSHMLEHMAFKGTSRFPNQKASEMIAQLGGVENAFTSRDYTVFHYQIASEQLSIPLQIEADRMSALQFDPEQFSAERKVVLEERQRNVDNRPNALFFEQFFLHAYLTSPYRHPVIGWPEEIQSWSLEQVQEWYRKWYTPNNAILVVAGDVEPEKVYAEVASLFTDSPSQSALTPPSFKRRKEPAPSGPRQFELALPAQRPLFLFGFQTPSLSTAFSEERSDVDALLLLSAALSEGKSAPLHHRLVREKQIAASVTTGYDPFLRDDALFFWMGEPAQNASLEELEKAFEQEIAQLKNELINPIELESVKTRLNASSIYRRDAIFERAREVGQLATLELDLSLINTLDERIAQITPEALRAAAERYLTPERLTIGRLIPQRESLSKPLSKPALEPSPSLDNADTSQREPTAQIPQTAQRVLPERLDKRSTEEVRERSAVPTPFLLDNGLRVLFLRVPDLPIVDLHLSFDAGSARDGDDFGLAHLTNRLLSEGAGTLSAQELAFQLDQHGALFRSYTGRDRAAIQLRSLAHKETLHSVIDALKLLLQKPRFDLEAITQQKALTLTQIEARAQSPSTLADQLFYETLYSNHPYAHPPIGHPTSLEMIDQGTIKNFYQRYYVAHNGLLTLVGDLSLEEATLLAEQLAGELPSGERAPSLPEPEPLTDSITVYLPYPSPQTHIRIGSLGESAQFEGRYALSIANDILGGRGLRSRLGQVLREQHGLTYHISSRFAHSAVKAPFLISTEVSRDRMIEAIGKINSTFNQFIQEGISEKEHEESISGLIGRFPLLTASNLGTLSQIVHLGEYQLPLDRLVNYPKLVQKHSLDEINQTFSETLSPNHWVTVVVGGSQ
jgi:zinc protease